MKMGWSSHLLDMFLTVCGNEGVLIWWKNNKAMQVAQNGAHTHPRIIRLQKAIQVHAALHCTTMFQKHRFNQIKTCHVGIWKMCCWASGGMSHHIGLMQTGFQAVNQFCCHRLYMNASWYTYPIREYLINFKESSRSPLKENRESTFKGQRRCFLRARIYICSTKKKGG